MRSNQHRNAFLWILCYKSLLYLYGFIGYRFLLHDMLRYLKRVPPRFFCKIYPWSLKLLLGWLEYNQEKEEWKQSHAYFIVQDMFLLQASRVTETWIRNMYWWNVRYPLLLSSLSRSITIQCTWTYFQFTGARMLCLRNTHNGD